MLISITAVLAMVAVSVFVVLEVVVVAGVEELVVGLYPKCFKETKTSVLSLTRHCE